MTHIISYIPVHHIADRQIATVAAGIDDSPDVISTIALGNVLTSHTVELNLEPITQ